MLVYRFQPLDHYLFLGDCPVGIHIKFADSINHTGAELIRHCYGSKGRIEEMGWRWSVLCSYFCTSMIVGVGRLVIPPGFWDTLTDSCSSSLSVGEAPIEQLTWSKL